MSNRVEIFSDAKRFGDASQDHLLWSNHAIGESFLNVSPGVLICDFKKSSTFSFKNHGGCKPLHDIMECTSNRHLGSQNPNI